MAKVTPKRIDLPYLIGWYLLETQGDHREAKRLAQEYLKEMKNDKAK